ncbi:unnamed protein product [Caenorhabditis bovis]|nr:unnamed protein product [Caenorhabditis bovis]
MNNAMNTRYVMFIDEPARRQWSSYSLYVMALNYRATHIESKLFGILSDVAFGVWHKLPVELKKCVIERMDYRTRKNLAQCSRLMYELENESRVYIVELSISDSFSPEWNERFLTITVSFTACSTDLHSEYLDVIDYGRNKYQIVRRFLMGERDRIEVRTILEKILKRANWNVNNLNITVFPEFLKPIIEKIDFTMLIATMTDADDLKDALEAIPHNLKKVVTKERIKDSNMELGIEILSTPQIKTAQSLKLVNFCHVNLKLVWSWAAKTIHIFTDDLREPQIEQFMMKVLDTGILRTISVRTTHQLNLAEILRHFDIVAHRPIANYEIPYDLQETLKSLLEIGAKRDDDERIVFEIAFCDLVNRNFQPHYYRVALKIAENG